MDKSYNLLMESEPSEEQLENLMHAVLQEVKEKAYLADQGLFLVQKQQIKEALERQKQRYEKK